LLEFFKEQFKVAAARYKLHKYIILSANCA